MSWNKRHYVLAGVILFFIAVNVLFYLVSPSEIVESIGTHNSYLIVFLLAAIGGLSTLTGTVLFTTLATFVLGGANPLLLGLASGAGLFISDSIFFLLASLGRKYVPPEWETWIARMREITHRWPTWLVFLAVYIYLGFTPLPNDVLMIALVLSGYRYRRLAPVFLAGAVTLALVFAYSASLFSSTPTDLETGVVTEREPISLCFQWSLDAGGGEKDTAYLRMDLRGEGGTEATGRFDYVPAYKDSKTGEIEGVVSPLIQEIMGRRAELWWSARAEGTLVQEELLVTFGEGTASVAFGEMVDRGDGVYVYKDKSNLSYLQLFDVTCD